MILRTFALAIVLLFIAGSLHTANGIIQQRPQRPAPPVSEDDYLPEFSRPNVIRSLGSKKAEGVQMPIASQAPARFYTSADDPEAFRFSKRVVNDSVSSGVKFSTISSFDCAGLACNTPFEPAAAASGNNVFITGNRIAVASSSRGTTWQYANPALTHSSFCCDQDVVFSPSINRFIWWRQGLIESDGSNINTLVVSGVNSTTPEFLWTLSASDFDGTISGTWLDYPRIDVSNGFLYMTWNLYNNAGGYTGSGIGRIPLADLSTGGSLRKEFIMYRNNGIALATGVGMSSMWYLMERGPAYCCSVLRWDDDQPYPVAAVRSIPFVYIGKGDASCRDTNGEDACSKIDARKQAGFYAPPGIVGFMWMQKSQEEYGLPFPFVGYATFNATTLEPIISDGVIASDQHAIVYPAVSGGSGSNVAVAYYGVGNNTKHYFALGSLGSTYMRPIFQNTMATSNNVKWGDYSRLRPYYPDTNSFVAVGYRMNGTCDGTNFCTKLEGVFIIFNGSSPASEGPIDSPVSPPLAPPLPTPEAPPVAAPVAAPIAAPVSQPVRPPQFDAPSDSPMNAPTPSTFVPPAGASTSPDVGSTSPSGATSNPSSNSQNNNNNGYVDPTPGIAAAFGAILGLVLVGLVIAIILKKKNVI